MNKKSKNKPVVRVFDDRWKYILVVFVLLVYAKSMDFGFVLDDDLFVKNHPSVQEGVSSIPANFSQGSMLHFRGSNFQIYRPFTISFFTIEHALFGLDASGYHVVSILLYALICLLVYNLLRSLFPESNGLTVLLAAGLFALHPVHTEVVANIKGQDELLSAVGCLLSLWLFVRHIDTGSRRLLVYSVTAYAVALFSKESAAVFSAVFPATYFLVRKDKFFKMAKSSLPFFMAAGAFVLCRQLALTGLRQDYETTVIENVLYGASNPSEAWSTRFSILLYFLRLMVWPVSLSWDYSYNQIPLSNWSDVWPIVSVVAFVALIVLAFVMRRRSMPVSWGLTFFLVTILPTSNLLFLNGTTFAERFLFLPSVGCIAAVLPVIARLYDRKSGQFEVKRLLIPAAVMIAFAYAASGRVGDWKDNLTLFESAARNAPNSSRVQAGLATEYMNKAEKAATMIDRQKYMDLSRSHFEASLRIFPENADANYKLALIESIAGDTAKSVRLYSRCLAIKPDQVFARVNLATIYASRAEWDSAAGHLEMAFMVDSLNEMVLTNLVVVNYNRRRSDEVERYAGVARRNGLMSSKIDDLLKMSRSRVEGR